MIDIFVELGRRIESSSLEGLYRCACRDNNWFTASDVAYAVEAIRDMMLSRERLEEWAGAYSALPVERAENILIVMAGNIPLVGFFDLLCVLMAGHFAIVKPSHKDRVLMEWVVGELRDIEPSIPIYNLEERQPERVIATGGDAAVLYFGGKYKGVPTLLRGSRHSVAVVGEGGVAALGDDIYRYSGLGCRNISLIFVPKGYDLSRIPRGGEHPKFRNNYLQNRALLRLSGVEFYDSGSSCLIRQDCFPLQISTLSIVEYESRAQVARWIEQHEDELQCIVADKTMVEHPRRVDIGEAQRPTLWDYADGVDTMKFLE